MQNAHLSNSVHVAHATSFQRSEPETSWSFSPPFSPPFTTQNAARSAPHIPIIFPIKSSYFPSAIMSRNALNLLRSATSSLSPRAATRSYHPIRRRAAIHPRTYSNTTSENVNGTSGGTGNAEKKAADTQQTVPPLSELEAKLKTKEDEVLDITVRPVYQLVDAAVLTFRNFRAGYDISRPTF